VIRYNYTKQECFALAEVLGTVKGLVSRLLNAVSLLSPVLARCAHDEIQEFLHGVCGDVLQHASKKKRSIKTEMITMRGILGDWAASDGPSELASSKSKKGAATEPSVEYPSRAVFPSAIQVQT
jgi:hypothetical protein